MRIGRRSIPWVATVLLLMLLVWALYRVIDRVSELGPEPGLDQLLLPAMSLLLVVMVLTLAGILIRNLVRVIVERKQGVLGARLRSKLVFFFLALVLLPALVLFSGSAQVIKQSVEAVLRTPLDDLTRRARESVEQWREYVQNQARFEADSLASQIARGGALEAGGEALLDRLVEGALSPGDGREVWVVRNGRVLARAGALQSGDDPALSQALERMIRDRVERVAENGERSASIDYLGDRLLADAVVPVPTVAGEPRAQVAVAILLPADLVGNLEEIDEADRMYRRFRVQRRELIRLYLTLIGLVFLVTLFVATWIGFYLARRITGPIQELASAAREISTGNLDVRVRTDVGDEMGMLVDAFNEMTAELQESRTVITRSTADLRRSNQALDERRRYIETLLANLSTAVLSLDPQGRATTANPAVRRILGVELHTGEPVRPRLLQAGLDPLVELLDAAVSPSAEEVRRELMLTRNGEALTVSVQISPLLGGAGETPGTLVMVEDLTELLVAQRAAAWREAARRIAHEIKNPLTPIQLWAQRLRKKHSTGADDLDLVLPEATASIEREVGALKRLVDEFSLFARLPEVRPRPTELAALVDSVLALYQGHPGIRWQIDIADGLDAVPLDPDQFRRVLINLVDNAISAMQGRGTIGMRAQRVGEGTLRVEVEDDGPGIDPEDRTRMFSPYFSTKKRGTGLGLAIVHKVISDHQGTIRVEAHRPSGVRFVIEIPV